LINYTLNIIINTYKDLYEFLGGKKRKSRKKLKKPKRKEKTMKKKTRK
jgi:hypothetical protein